MTAIDYLYTISIETSPGFNPNTIFFTDLRDAKMYGYLHIREMKEKVPIYILAYRISRDMIEYYDYVDVSMPFINVPVAMSGNTTAEIQHILTSKGYSNSFYPQYINKMYGTISNLTGLRLYATSGTILRMLNLTLMELESVEEYPIQSMMNIMKEYEMSNYAVLEGKRQYVFPLESHI